MNQMKKLKNSFILLILSLILIFSKCMYIFADPETNSDTSIIAQTEIQQQTETQQIETPINNDQTIGYVNCTMYQQNSTTKNLVAYVSFRNKETMEVTVLNFEPMNSTTLTQKLPVGEYLVAAGILNDNLGKYTGTTSYTKITVTPQSKIDMNAFVGDDDYTKVKELYDNTKYEYDENGEVFLPNTYKIAGKKVGEDYDKRISEAVSERTGSVEEASSYFYVSDEEKTIDYSLEGLIGSTKSKEEIEEELTTQETQSFKSDEIDTKLKSSNDTNKTSNKNSKSTIIVIIILTIVIIISIIAFKIVRKIKEYREN